MKKIRKITNEMAQSITAFVTCYCPTDCSGCRDSTTAVSSMEQYQFIRQSVVANKK